MVEFVLREKDYRERMMREVHDDYWMAPTLRGGKSSPEDLHESEPEPRARAEQRTGAEHECEPEPRTR